MCSRSDNATSLYDAVGKDAKAGELFAVALNAIFIIQEGRIFHSLPVSFCCIVGVQQGLEASNCLPNCTKSLLS